MPDPIIRIRKDVWKLAPWDPILEWYARAVADMMKRPISDPTSWRYQAAIHDYANGQDPLATPADALPSPADQQTFWRQCQHGSWFFLPWHRMYLRFFEQIVAAAVVKLGGPEDWALPYWNYSDKKTANAQKLPPAFREKKLPDGSPNALRVTQRASACNAGRVVGDEFDVDLEPSLTDAIFTTSSTGGDPGFGGPKTGFQHSSGTIGTVELAPHGSMHVAVGGNTGWMSAFNTAPLDPIFWLHHANIDRLWEVWRQRDAVRHVDPVDAAWLTTVRFSFHDAAAAVVMMNAGQVVDTTVAPFFYKYEDTSDPLAAVVPPPSALPEGIAMREKPIPEMVGATDEPVVLGTGTTTRAIPVNAPTGPALPEGAAGVMDTREIYLNLENVTGAGTPGGYAVYLNLPEGASPADHRDRFAGIVPLFGLEESSRPDAEHGGAGLHYSLKVTAIVGQLAREPGWNPDALRVTFVYRGTGETAPDVRVGRVSLYYA